MVCQARYYPPEYAKGWSSRFLKAPFRPIFFIDQSLPPPPSRPPSPTANNSFRSYYLSGFLTLQTTLDRFLFNRALPAGGFPEEDRSGEQSEERSGVATGGFACAPPDVVGVPFPTAAYDQNLFYAAAGYLLGLAMTMVSSRAGISSSGRVRDCA